MKLFLKDEVLTLRNEVLQLFHTLQSLSEKHKDVLLPGYTHGQVAMPSSFGLWFGAYAEALADDMYMLRGAFNVTDQNPLGSAAGYGSSFPLDRQMTTELLDFGSLDYNVVAAQLSRGKSERAVASAMGAIALTLNKFAADCCMYMSPNYGFIKFPDELTTGSSIMPHKKNPDVWEIMRGNCNRIMATENEISMLCSNMPHGYHREFQLLKDILFPALELMHKCLMMADYMLQHIIVKENILDAPIYELSHTIGLKGVLGGDYDYNLTQASVYNRFWLNSWGHLDMHLRGGVQWNDVPWWLMCMPATNLSYFSQPGSFYLINNMEFIHDRYASIHLSWDINGKLLNRIPMISRLKWREHVGLNMLWGDVNSSTEKYTSSTKPYLEAAIGIHNIFRFFHVDYVRRFTHLDNPDATKHGIRLGFSMKF